MGLNAKLTIKLYAAMLRHPNQGASGLDGSDILVMGHMALWVRQK